MLEVVCERKWGRWGGGEVGRGRGGEVGRGLSELEAPDIVHPPRPIPAAAEHGKVAAC